MDCVITAGGIPQPDDPVYVYTQGKSKALLDMGGRTMLERVVDALQSSQSIGDIVVAGLGDDSGMRFQRPVRHIPDQGRMLANVLAGINWIRERKPESRNVIICSADIPTLTGPIIDKFVESCRPFDKAVYYPFVTKETMETRFPGSRRTFVKLKGVQVAGGDVVLVHADLAATHQELWHAVSNARKHAWQLARIVGLGTLLRFLTHRLDFADIEKIGQRMIDRPVKIIISLDAELAMDADKPSQVDLLRADWQQRAMNTTREI
jgi:GTP:adenosylcobinamide-phosphate guanylyltransferase